MKSPTPAERRMIRRFEKKFNRDHLHTMPEGQPLKFILKEIRLAEARGYRKVTNYYKNLKMYKITFFEGETFINGELFKTDKGQYMEWHIFSTADPKNKVIVSY